MGSPEIEWIFRDAKSSLVPSDRVFAVIPGTSKAYGMIEVCRDGYCLIWQKGCHEVYASANNLDEAKELVTRWIESGEWTA